MSWSFECLLLHKQEIINFNDQISISSSEKLVIDSDGGADDAAAILLVLSAWANKDSKFEVVALTCVNGNTGEANVEHNTLKTLTIANVSNVIARCSRKHEVRTYLISI